MILVPREGRGALTQILWWQLGDMALPCCELHQSCPSLPWDAGAGQQEQGLMV